MNDNLKITSYMPENNTMTHYIISKVDYDNLMNACKSTIMKPVITEQNKAHNIEAHAIIATLKRLEAIKFI